MKTHSKNMAFCGVMASLAVVIMALGGLIPVATYVCPVLCMLILRFVLAACASRLAWCWYGVGAVLSLLLSPDKEASAVFLGVGYYPILKPRFEALKGKWLFKFGWFNAVVIALYWVLIQLLGIDQVADDFQELGIIMMGLLLLTGNMVFFMTDRLLDMLQRRGLPNGKGR